jgi:hypothetical protein
VSTCVWEQTSVVGRADGDAPLQLRSTPESTPYMLAPDGVLTLRTSRESAEFIAAPGLADADVAVTVARVHQLGRVFRR